MESPWHTGPYYTLLERCLQGDHSVIGFMKNSSVVDNREILLYVFTMFKVQIPAQNYQFFNNVFTMFATKHWKLPAVYAVLSQPLGNSQMNG